MMEIEGLLELTFNSNTQHFRSLFVLTADSYSERV